MLSEHHGSAEVSHIQAESDESYNNTDNEEEMVEELENGCKKRKNKDEGRTQRCRERNRIHARNTRERKRAQMDFLQQRIQDLNDEKLRLERIEPDDSVASILMSLSSTNQPTAGISSEKHHPKTHGSTEFLSKRLDRDSNYVEDYEDTKNFAAETIERLKTEISATLSDDEELDMDQDLLTKDKSSCTTKELEMIRRERNRMHAKKTRLRKKKMLSEMEAIIHGLEEDIRRLRQQRGMAAEEGDGVLPGCPSSGNRSGPLSHGGKFTGFRHTNKTGDASCSSSSACGMSSSGSASNSATFGLPPGIGGGAVLGVSADQSAVASASAAAAAAVAAAAFNPAGALNFAAMLNAASALSGGGFGMGMGVGSSVPFTAPAGASATMLQGHPNLQLSSLHASLVTEYEKMLRADLQQSGSRGLNSMALDYYSCLLGLAAGGDVSGAVSASGRNANPNTRKKHKKPARVRTGFAPSRAGSTSSISCGSNSSLGSGGSSSSSSGCDNNTSSSSSSHTSNPVTKASAWQNSGESSPPGCPVENTPCSDLAGSVI